MTMPVSHVTVRVPLTIRRRPGRKTLVSLGFGAEGSRIATKADPALVKALARAFRYQKLLDEGRYASISEMATAEKIERGYLGTLLRLTRRRLAGRDALVARGVGAAGSRLATASALTSSSFRCAF